jgi:hypothetical protein
MSILKLVKTKELQQYPQFIACLAFSHNLRNKDKKQLKKKQKNGQP